MSVLLSRQVDATALLSHPAKWSDTAPGRVYGLPVGDITATTDEGRFMFGRIQTPEIEYYANLFDQLSSVKIATDFQRGANAYARRKREYFGSSSPDLWKAAKLRTFSFGATDEAIASRPRRQMALNRRQPRLYAGVCSLLGTATHRARKAWPAVLGQQEDWANLNVEPVWSLPGSHGIFSTATVDVNAFADYHQNLASRAPLSLQVQRTASGQSVWVVFPEYRAAIEVGNDSVLCLMGHEVHGTIVADNLDLAADYKVTVEAVMREGLAG